MPVNVDPSSHGAAPAALSPQQPASPRGGSRAAAQVGAAAELRSRKAPGNEAVRPERVVSLPDLPSDLLRQIVVRLPAESSGRLTAVDRASNRTMRELGEPTAEPRAVVNKAVQMASESWRDLSLSDLSLSAAQNADITMERSAVVEQVWQRGLKSSKELPSVLKAAFAARAQLQLPHERAGLMKQFARMLDRAATPDERFDVASHLLRAAQQLDSPELTEMPLLIADRIDQMPPDLHARAFNMICRNALTRLGKADMLTTLQTMIGKLEFAGEQPLDVMKRLACHGQDDPSWDPPTQAQLLAMLADGIRSIKRGRERMEAFDWLWSMAEEVPAEHRLPTLEALSRQLHELPMEVRADTLQNLCSGIRDLTAATDPEFADRLAMQLYTWPLATGPHVKWPLYDGMAGPEDDRMPIDPAPRPMMGAIAAEPHAALDTVRQMNCESLMNSPDALRAAFAARDRLPPGERSGLTAHLAEMLERAPGTHAQAVAAGHLFVAAQRLDSPARAEVSALIAARIGQMHPDVQLEVFSIITQDVMNELGKADMLAPLQALAGQLEALPVERRFHLMAVLGYQNLNHPDAASQGLSLDPPAQAQLLVTLAKGIRSLGVEERLDAFHWMRIQVLQLPAEHRLSVQKALSRRIRLLPKSDRLPALWELRLEIRNVTATEDPLFADRLTLQIAGTLSLPLESENALLSEIIKDSIRLPPQLRHVLLAEIRRMYEDAHRPEV